MDVSTVGISGTGGIATTAAGATPCLWRLGAGAAAGPATLARLHPHISIIMQENLTKRFAQVC